MNGNLLLEYEAIKLLEKYNLQDEFPIVLNEITKNLKDKLTVTLAFNKSDETLSGKITRNLETGKIVIWINYAEPLKRRRFMLAKLLYFFYNDLFGEDVIEFEISSNRKH